MRSDPFGYFGVENLNVNVMPTGSGDGDRECGLHGCGRSRRNRRQGHCGLWLALEPVKHAAISFCGICHIFPCK
jgi:hypothetical protein